MNHREENLPPIPPIKAQMPPIPPLNSNAKATATDSDAPTVAADTTDCSADIAVSADSKSTGVTFVVSDEHDDQSDDPTPAEAEVEEAKTERAKAETEADETEARANADEANAEATAEAQVNGDSIDDVMDKDLSSFDGQPICNEGTFTRLFSFKGRITRLEYLLSFLSIQFASILHSLVQQVEMTAGGTGCCARATAWSCFAVVCWLITAQGVKRLHDTGRTGWLWYVPFLFIWLFLARGQKTTNRYGTPARISSSTPARKAEVRRLRRHGLWCAITWLLFPPAYLWLAMRWRMQQFLVRLLLFAGAPACVACVMAINQHNADEQRRERAEDMAREATAKKVLGVELDIDDIHTIVWSPERGTSRYELVLDDDHPERLYNALDRLAAERGRGWKAECLDVDTGNDDYGHYYEDYGTPTADSLCPNNTWRFAGTFRHKSDGQKRHVRLVVQRDDPTIYLEVR